MPQQEDHAESELERAVQLTAKASRAASNARTMERWRGEGARNIQMLQEEVTSLLAVVAALQRPPSAEIPPIPPDLLLAWCSPRPRDQETVVVEIDGKAVTIGLGPIRPPDPDASWQRIVETVRQFRETA